MKVVLSGFLLAGLLLSFTQSHSQQASYTPITGKIIGTDGTPIPYASVALYGTADSALVGGSVSDNNGKFEVPASPGDYFIKVSFLSFDDQVIPDIHVTESSPLNVGNVTLKESSQVLDEFVIEEDKSQMELKLDKRVFNVSKDLSNTGSNASEILSNVPSVEVDVEGRVSLRGSENVRILIDGKPSGLTGAGNTDALRMLQGNMIEQVEVITNPSSRFDAEGEVGIINIVLKKEKKQGVNGAFDLTAGYPHNHSGSFSLNYRRNWINVFASNGFSYRKTPGYGHSIQQYDGPDTAYYYTNDRDQVRGNLSNTSRAGADIYLNERNSITAALLYQLSQGRNETQLEYNDLDNSSEVLATTTRDEVEIEDEQTIETMVSYRKTFAKEGRSWNTDFKMIRDDDVETATLTQVSSLPSVTPYDQRSANTENERNYVFQSDYIHPLGKEGKFETGLKASLREIENTFQVELNQSGTWELLDDFTNELIYTENIYAAYAMYSSKYKRLSYQGGVRSEYSDIKTELIRTNESNPRSYLNFFPSVHLSYEVRENSALQLSFSRRLSRPEFRDLIPFMSYSDPRNYRSGNPDLDPEYTNAFEAGYLKTLGKGSFLGSLYYRHSTGVVERITVTDSTGLIRNFPINLSTQHAAGLELNLSYELTKWWRMNGNVNLYRAIVQGEYRSRDYNSDTYTATSRVTSIIKLPKDINFQASGNYSAPRNTTQGKRLAMYNLDLAFSRDVLKGNGTLTASVRNVLDSQKFRSITDTPYLHAEGEFQFRPRQFVVGFNYRLNQKKKEGRSQEGSGGYQDFDM